MKLIFATATMLSLALPPLGGNAFRPSPRTVVSVRGRQHAQRLVLASTPSPEDMKRIMEEESKNPATLAASAEKMKNMSPGDMDTLVKEMESMPDDQKEQLKSMGMDPDTMMISMKMMRENPNMMATAQKLMSSMTPEEMIEQSRVAQEKMKSFSKEDLEKATQQAKEQMESMDPEMVDEAIKAMKEAKVEVPGGKTVPAGVAMMSSSDPNVVDAMFLVGEMMSKPPTGGVTLQAFATLPPVTALSGPRDEDLSKQELAECWEDASNGSVRVDRSGFERVWKEVQEYFEEDLMEEARTTSAAKIKKSRSGATTSETESTTSTKAEVVGADFPQVGANMSEDQMNAVNSQVKNMSDGEWQQMMDSMADIGPEEEARMKAMGADPAMMKKAADMMKSNPMMRKAAQMMMKNMSPDQMMQASQQAQKQMQNMSAEDLNNIEKQMNEKK